MTILQICATIVVIGVVLYVVNAVVPMQSQLKTILNVVVVLAVCFWLLGLVWLPIGFWDHRIGR